jgi:hypothetical protein
MNLPEKIEAALGPPPMPSPAMPVQATPSSALPSRAMLCHAAQCRELVYHKKLARVLDRMGSLYTVNDLLTAIREGRMQSFTHNNSWVITQIQDFPRARQLELIAYVGDLTDLDALHDKILKYADEVNAGLLSTHGRMGWLREGSFERLGWRLKAKSHLYQREM